jgi:hypothetical protein
VGGPQAPKILGEVDEHEVVTLPPFPVGRMERRIPRDTQTRFAQRLHGRPAEAYEWGGLTVATAAKALWVLYLPFTLINAGGWAHAPVDGHRNRKLARWHRALAHTSALLATFAYIAWIAYLTLELVATAWVAHVRSVDRPRGLTGDFVLIWVPRLAPVACIGLVLALLAAPWLRGSFEDDSDGDSPQQPERWSARAAVADPDFFAHRRSHARWRAIHLSVGVTALAGFVVSYAVGIHRTGLVLLLLAAVQAVVVTAIAIVDACGRYRVLPSEGEGGALMLDQAIDDRGARLPAGATFVSLGTCLAHAAFAGLAMTLSPILARWPTDASDDALEVGAELAAGDVLAWALVLIVVFSAAIFLRTKAAVDQSAAGTTKQGAAVRLARRAPQLGFAALLAFSIPVAVYGGLNRDAVQPIDGCPGLERIVCWYDDYDVQDRAVFKRLGALVLVALPGAVYGVLSRKHDSGVGRVIGNVWDVLTFWPRRFHPYAAPCSAERAVPELRARIRYVLRDGGLVVVAHSQGSVLAAAAIGSLRPFEKAPGLVTFGSPLGTLYCPTWPGYIPPLLATVRLRVAFQHPTQPWTNFGRVTDPVGDRVPGARNQLLHEPQAPPVGSLQPAAAERPLERPTRWGTVAGHSHYLADPDVQRAIAERRGR